MPCNIDPRPGEEVYLQREFRGAHDHVFTMAVSNQALYVSAQKLVPKRDPWYFKRVPLNEVTVGRLVKQRPIYQVVLSIIMIAFGAVLSTLMMWRAFQGMPGVPFAVSGWPFAIAIGGIIIPFIARGRKILTVKMRRDKFKWKPQLAIDKKTRELCSNLQDEIVAACEKVGVHTVVSRR